MSDKATRVYALLIGIGIVLFAVHNPYQPLIEYLFLPRLGMIMAGMGTFMYVFQNRRVSLGSPYVWVPLLVIVACITATTIYRADWSDRVAAPGPIVYGALMFLMYVAARNIGSRIFVPFTWAVVIAAVGNVAWGLANETMPHGGIVSPTNYDITTGLLVFGTLVSALNTRWWLTTIALVGLFFTGAPEAIVAVLLLGIIILARRDWSRAMIAPVVVGLTVLAATFGAGYAQDLYSYAVWSISTKGDALPLVSDIIPEKLHPYAPGGGFENPLLGRFRVIGEALRDFHILGHGYTIDRFTEQTVHNVPLVIVQQVGPIAALAWLWVTCYMLVKTTWRYAFAGVLILGIFDHFIWTQVAPWWWVLVGVASASEPSKDYIFKGHSLVNPIKTLKWPKGLLRGKSGSTGHKTEAKPVDLDG